MKKLITITGICVALLVGCGNTTPEQTTTTTTSTTTTVAPTTAPPELNSADQHQINEMAARMTWDNMSPSEQQTLCDAVLYLDRDTAMAALFKGSGDYDLAATMYDMLLENCSGRIGQGV